MDYPDRTDAATPTVPSLPSVSALTPSSDAIVVLSSLARASVPAFSDACTVELSEGTEPMFRVSYPLTEDEDPAQTALPIVAAELGDLQGVVATPFEVPSSHGSPSCAGFLVHRWFGRSNTVADAMVARLLVDQAILTVHLARVSCALEEVEERAAGLAIEAISARTIGEATGRLLR